MNQSINYHVYDCLLHVLGEFLGIIHILLVYMKTFLISSLRMIFGQFWWKWCGGYGACETAVKCFPGLKKQGDIVPVIHYSMFGRRAVIMPIE